MALIGALQHSSQQTAASPCTPSPGPEIRRRTYKTSQHKISRCLPRHSHHQDTTLLSSWRRCHQAGQRRNPRPQYASEIRLRAYDLFVRFRYAVARVRGAITTTQLQAGTHPPQRKRVRRAGTQTQSPDLVSKRLPRNSRTDFALTRGRGSRQAGLLGGGIASLVFTPRTRS